ncbi:MAG: hypothetical protein ABI811_06535 [Acidobacteriota bacterium]
MPILVRNCFTTKPGSAGTLAAKMKQAFAAAGIPRHRVLTDLTGGFNRVIVEFEVASAGEAETTIRNYRNSSAFREIMAGYTDLWQSGTREMLQIL